VKRLLLLVVVLAAVAPGTAHAATPCRDRIYNDWYPDGKIGTKYPISCYRDALRHIRSDALIYSSLSDDIRSAMQAAIARLHHQAHVPAQVGKGVPVSQQSNRPNEVSLRSTKRPPAGPEQTSLPTSTLASAPASGSGNGVPVPLLVLGALALLLVAGGAAGLVARRRRS
jgi:hypothetical protein